MTEEIKLEDLPFHELKKRASQIEGVTVKATYKKEDLIKIIKSDAPLPEKPKPVVKNLGADRIEAKLPLLPEGAKAPLAEMQAKGLTYTIDESTCSIIFKSPAGLTTSCTLDTTERNIISAARDSFGARRPQVLGYGQRAGAAFGE